MSCLDEALCCAKIVIFCYLHMTERDSSTSQNQQHVSRQQNTPQWLFWHLLWPTFKELFLWYSKWLHISPLQSSEEGWPMLWLILGKKIKLIWHLLLFKQGSLPLKIHSCFSICRYRSGCNVADEWKWKNKRSALMEHVRDLEVRGNQISPKSFNPTFFGVFFRRPLGGSEQVWLQDRLCVNVEFGGQRSLMPAWGWWHSRCQESQPACCATQLPTCSTVPTRSHKLL